MDATSGSPTKVSGSSRRWRLVAFASSLIGVASWLLLDSTPDSMREVGTREGRMGDVVADPRVPDIAAAPAPSIEPGVRGAVDPESDTTLLRLHVVADDGRALPRVTGIAHRLGTDGEFIPGASITLGPTDRDGWAEVRLFRGTFDLRINDWKTSRGDTIGLYGIDGNPARPDPRTLLTHEGARFPRLEVFGEVQERTVVLLRLPCGLEVIVRDGNANPVAGLEVGVGFHPAVTTGADGVARVDCLPEGAVEVALVGAAFGPGKPFSTTMPKQTVTLRAGEPARVEFEVVRNGAVELAIASCGEAPRELRVHCDDDDPSDAFGGRFEATGVGGSSVRFEGVPPSRYSIRTTLGSDDACWAPPILGVRVVEGTTTRVDLPLAPMTRTFSGRVVDSTDTPRSDVLVTVFDLVSGAVRKSARTNRAGEFSIEGLPDVPLRGGCDPTKSPGDPPAFFGSFEQPWFEVPATNAPLELRLERGCTIRGTLIARGQSGHRDLRVAIDRFHSRFESAVSARSTFTDARGAHYEFEFTNLRRGAYRLRVDDTFSTATTPMTEVLVSPETQTTREVEVVLEYSSSR